MEKLGYRLTRYQEENWKLLRNRTLKIFQDQIKLDHELAAAEDKKD